MDEVTEGATDNDMVSISDVILLGSIKFESIGFGGNGGGFTIDSQAVITSLPIKEYSIIIRITLF